MFYNVCIATNERVETKGWYLMNEEKERVAPDMTDDECRKKIIEIFLSMDRTDKLHFWYKYIISIEKGED